jgi:hypothetical protein
MLFEILYRLTAHPTRLGAQGFYPIPERILPLFKRYPLAKQIVTYARLCNGVDLSFIAPNDVGCAESVTRLLREVDQDLVPVITGTWTLLEHIRRSKRFREVKTPFNSCVVIAATGTGNGSIQGHVGIYDNGRIWNNTSRTGKWSASFTLQAFKARYQITGGMPVRYFLPTQ